MQLAFSNVLGTAHLTIQIIFGAHSIKAIIGGDMDTPQVEDHVINVPECAVSIFNANGYSSEV